MEGTLHLFQHYKPVCGDNGRTYHNKCYLEIVSFGKAKIARKGACPDSETGEITCDCKPVM